MKRLLPKGTIVRLVDLEDVVDNDGAAFSKPSSSSSTPRVWIIREKDELLINRELVRAGFALVRRGTKAPPGMMDELLKLERAAKDRGLGIYTSCADDDNRALDNENDNNNNSNNSVRTSNFVAEFEPLDYTTEIRYGDDGGKSIIVSRRDVSSAPPPDPGDVRGCSDFRTYEEALGWYETYAPYYGDVARLDRDGDGVPCPGLPHTTVGERYRMKKPNNGAK